jgi:hypothetical protein
MKCDMKGESVFGVHNILDRQHELILRIRD